MRELKAALCAAATLACNPAFAQDVYWNMSGKVSSYSGSSSNVSVGDAMQFSVKMRTTTDLTGQSSQGWYQTLNAIGGMRIGSSYIPINFVVGGGYAPSATIDVFDRSADSIWADLAFDRYYEGLPLVDRPYDTLSLRAFGSSSALNSDKLYGLETDNSKFDRSSLSQRTYDGSSAAVIEYSNVSWSFSSTAPAVPEPSTWMMMIIGFGAVGYSMRRKTVLRYV